TRPRRAAVGVRRRPGRASAARRGRSGSAGPRRAVRPGTGPRSPGRVRGRRRRGRAAPRPSLPRGGRPGSRGAARASSEGEEPSPLGRRARRLVAPRDGAQLPLELLELVPLPRLELLEFPAPPLLELLERRPPAGVEARQRLLDAAHHAERRDERALAVRAVEDDAGAEVGERDGVLPGAPEAGDRNLPLRRRRNGEPGRLG